MHSLPLLELEAGVGGFHRAVLPFQAFRKTLTSSSLLCIPWLVAPLCWAALPCSCSHSPFQCAWTLVVSLLQRYFPWHLRHTQKIQNTLCFLHSWTKLHLFPYKIHRFQTLDQGYILWEIIQQEHRNNTQIIWRRHRKLEGIEIPGHQSNKCQDCANSTPSLWKEGQASQYGCTWQDSRWGVSHVRMTQD